jgi:HEAT repeat protein
MAAVLFYILLTVIAVLIVFACYLMVRILQVFFKARRLETMKNYETIIYSAVRKIGPEKTLETLLPDSKPELLEEVLLRMGDEGAEGWKDKVASLYELAGFYEKRLAQLDSRSKKQRIEGARCIGRIGNHDAVPRLRELLGEGREEVREAALFALGRMGTRDALEAMLEALERGDRWTEEKVAEAVEEAGDESRQLLIHLLQDDDPARRSLAAEVMGKVAGPEEAPALEAALEDEDIDVRARAADSLGKMRAVEARAGLLKALDDPEWEVRSQAAKALGHIGDAEDAERLVLCLRDREWWVRQNAAEALREMGEVGEGPLIETLWGDDRFARETAAQVLEEASLVERIVKDMRDNGDNIEGYRVIRRLAEIGCIGTLSQVLLDMPDEEIRDRLISHLSGIGNVELQAAIAACRAQEANEAAELEG